MCQRVVVCLGGSPGCKNNVPNSAKTLGSGVFAVIFRVYTKFASQRNGCCLKWTLVDPSCGQKEVTRKSPESPKAQNSAKTLVSEALVAIFGIYAKFASQRNGCCLKQSLVDPFGCLLPNESRDLIFFREKGSRGLQIVTFTRKV